MSPFQWLHQTYTTKPVKGAALAKCVSREKMINQLWFSNSEMQGLLAVQNVPNVTLCLCQRKYFHAVLCGCDTENSCMHVYKTSCCSFTPLERTTSQLWLTILVVCVCEKGIWKQQLCRWQSFDFHFFTISKCEWKLQSKWVKFENYWRKSKEI